MSRARSRAAGADAIDRRACPIRHFRIGAASARRNLAVWRHLPKARNFVRAAVRPLGLNEGRDPPPPSGRYTVAGAGYHGDWDHCCGRRKPPPN
jgi:hypothetical protein